MGRAMLDSNKIHKCDFSGVHVTVTCATQYVGNKDVRDSLSVCLSVTLCIVGL